MKPGLDRGQLTTWKDEQGFGFIQSVNRNQEIFLHISELKDSTRRPQVGDMIYYYVIVKDKKIRACNAFILGARKKPNSSYALSNKAVNSNYPFPILEVLLLSVLPLIGSLHFAWIATNPIPLMLYPIMSLLTFGLYSRDKFYAKSGERRIPEQTLHLCELAGGWLGGFIAQRILHHKNRKHSYQVTFRSIVVLHITLWAYWLFSGGNLMRVFLGSGFRR
jgi:uncharacterized membrane protein YsdA (DUF1294 family)/cold shock CspA family protein